MKKLLIAITSLFFSFISNLSFCQTSTVIDYTNFTTSQCNAFYPFPPTIGGLVHTTNGGTVIFNNATHQVELDASAANNIYKGTEYKIAYNFKQGYSYSIKINAKASLPAYPEPGSRLRVDFDRASNGGAFCNGPENFNTNSAITNNNNFLISPNIYSDYTFTYPSISAPQGYLYIGVYFPYINGTGSSYVLIKSVTITETPPSVSFTLTNPISVVCGKSNPVTLTVTNVYNTPGVTGYTWNLGANNNWLYQGSAAPASIITSGNSIVLTPVCGTTPSNVTATANVGTNNYNTNIGTVSSTVETLAITGTNPICSGSATYSIPNLPTCGASVTGWTVSPTGVFSITNNGNTATLTRITDGQVTLTAAVSITNPCYSSTLNVNYELSAGAVPLTGYYLVSSGYSQQGNNPLGPNNAAIFLPANQTFGVTAYITNSNISNASWSRNSSSYPFTWSSSGIQLNFNGNAGNVAYTSRNGKFDLTANTGCGVTTTTITWPVIPTSSTGRIAVSPNPVKNHMHVTLSNSSVKGTLETNQEYVTMTLYNASSTIPVKMWRLKNNQSAFDLDVSGLKQGQYVLKVIKDNVEDSRQITIE